MKLEKISKAVLETVKGHEFLIQKIKDYENEDFELVGKSLEFFQVWTFTKIENLEEWFSMWLCADYEGVDPSYLGFVRDENFDFPGEKLIMYLYKGELMFPEEYFDMFKPVESGV